MPIDPIGSSPFSRGLKDDLQILVRVTEGSPHQNGFVVRRLDVRRARKMIERDLVLFHPLGIRLAGCQLLFHFVIGDQSLLFRIHQQHAARSQLSFHAHVFRLYREHACLRSHDDQTVRGHHVPSRA